MAKGFTGMKRYRSNANKKKQALLDKVTGRAFRNLIEFSPVLTGNFRLNWFGSVGAPIIGDPGSRLKTSGALGVSQESVQNVGIITGSPPRAQEYQNLAPAYRGKFGVTRYITNNLDYAEGLENGRSKKAPAGVLRPAAQKTRAEMKK